MVVARPPFDRSPRLLPAPLLPRPALLHVDPGRHVARVDRHGALDLLLRLIHRVVEHFEEGLAGVPGAEFGEERLLDVLVPSLQQRDPELHHLGEDPGAGGGLYDEVDDEAGAALAVEVALDRVQVHLGPGEELAAGAVADGQHSLGRTALHRGQRDPTEVSARKTHKSSA